MKTITSRDNPRFKSLRALAEDGRERRRQGKTLLDGVHLVETWLARRGAPELLVISEHGLEQGEIGAFLAAHGGLEVLLLPDALFKQLSPVDSPTGILALVTLPQVSARPLAGSCVVLDGVQDAGNVGSILRSAAAAGISDAILTPGCAQAWSPRVLRAAMGAHCFLEIREQADAVAALADFPGLALATRLDPGARSLFDVDLAGPVAWLFGNEGAGLSAPLAARATASVLIPMPGAMESLNVAAAAAICLFEELRQKAVSGKR